MQHDALLPRPPAGLAPGAVLALLVHIGLIAALTLVVDWRMKTPEPVSAELWAAIPQLAAPEAVVAPTPAPVPAPPPPAPPPPAPAPAPAAPAPAVQEAKPDEAQIAIERAERRKLEREQQAVKAAADAERSKRESEQAKAAQAKAEQARLAKLREDQMQRMFGSMSASSPSPGDAARDAAPSQAYIGRLIARIKANVVFSDTVPGNPAAEVEVRAAPSGSIIARRLLRSSGVKEWDDAVLRAIDRTGSLPRDTDGRVPPTIIVEFRPKE